MPLKIISRLAILLRICQSANTTSVSFIKVDSSGRIYTEGSDILPNGRDVSAAEWRGAFGSVTNYQAHSFTITAHAAGGSTTITGSIAIYNGAGGTPSGYPGYSPGYVPPVALDLNHDGQISYTDTSVDVNGDGSTHTTAWVGSQDGVLVWDKYHDGKVA